MPIVRAAAGQMPTVADLAELMVARCPANLMRAIVNAIKDNSLGLEPLPLPLFRRTRAFLRGLRGCRCYPVWPWMMLASSPWYERGCAAGPEGQASGLVTCRPPGGALRSQRIVVNSSR